MDSLDGLLRHRGGHGKQGVRYISTDVVANPMERAAITRRARQLNGPSAAFVSQRQLNQLVKNRLEQQQKQQRLQERQQRIAQQSIGRGRLQQQQLHNRNVNYRRLVTTAPLLDTAQESVHPKPRKVYHDSDRNKRAITLSSTGNSTINLGLSQTGGDALSLQSILLGDPINADISPRRRNLNPKRVSPAGRGISVAQKEQQLYQCLQQRKQKKHQDRYVDSITAQVRHLRQARKQHHHHRQQHLLLQQSHLRKARPMVPLVPPHLFVSPVEIQLEQKTSGSGQKMRGPGIAQFLPGKV